MSASTKILPPGQQRVEGFPRFGSHFHRPPPAVPADPAIEIAGAVSTPTSIPVSQLASMPRCGISADFHCVAGWSATDLRWEGVAFATFFDEIVAPLVSTTAPITHVVFEGLDGYRSIGCLEDALAEDVLVADRLNGEPLDGDHGAPVRLVSPSQYGFMSTKHLCRIDVHTARPPERYHPSALVQFGLNLVKPHTRARVAREERHRYLPAWAVRGVYRLLIGPLRRVAAGT